MSSGLPSPARVIATAASRTSGCWALSAWAQRAMVRRASSAEITPSSLSHSTSRRQSSGPGGAAFGRSGGGAEGLMAGSFHRLEHPQPLAGRQAPARLDLVGARGQFAPRRGAAASRSASTTVLPSRVGRKAHTAPAPKAAWMRSRLRSKLEERPNRLTVMQPSSVSRLRQSA